MSNLSWSLGSVEGELRSITIYSRSNGRFLVAEDNPKFEEILQALRDKEDEDVVIDLVNEAISAIKNKTGGLFSVVEGQVVVTDNSEPVSDSLTNKILEFTEQDLDCSPLIDFHNNLSENISKSSRNQLHRFLNSNNVPIVDEDLEMEFTDAAGNTEVVNVRGFFVSWKSVDKNFTDHRTHTFDNSPGKVVSMSRRDVDDDPNVTCSSGLHVAAWDYAFQFMSSYGRYVKVYVNPKDVVSVPVDYNDQKIRVCKYYVVEEVENPERVNREESILVSSKFNYQDEESESQEEYLERMIENIESLCGDLETEIDSRIYEDPDDPEIEEMKSELFNLEEELEGYRVDLSHL